MSVLDDMRKRQTGQQKLAGARPAAPSFVTADRFKRDLCVMCRTNEAGFMGGPCRDCDKRLLSGSRA